MISIMEKELNNGISIRLNILEIFLMDKKQERENLSLMEMFMKVILQKIIFKDKVKWYGLMAQYMKVDSLTENKKDMEKRNGLMEATTKALGCKI